MLLFQGEHSPGKRFTGSGRPCAAFPRGLLPLAPNLYGFAVKGSTLPPLGLCTAPSSVH